MEFDFVALDGQSYEAKFSELEVVLDGPIALEDDWYIDRINYWLPQGRYIEFRSGPENPPGFVNSGAWEVTKEHVQELLKHHAPTNRLLA